MARITRLVLDVLKPHAPPVNLFAQHLADQAPRLQVTVEVVEIDEKTQTLSVTIEGDDIDLPEISDLIATMGGSLHSVDKVCALSDADQD